MSLEEMQKTFFEAAIRGQLEELRSLIATGVDLNCQNEKGCTALMGASAGPFPQAVRLLLDSGADTKIKDRQGRTALIWAVRGAIYEYNESAIAVVEALIASNADVNASSDDGASVLIYAASHNQPEIVQLLIKAGADGDAVSNGGWRAIDYAKEYGYSDVAEVLMKGKRISEGNPVDGGNGV